MTARIILPRSLAEHAEGLREFDVDSANGATLAEVIQQVSARYPALGRRVVDETGSLRQFVNVYVGVEECRRLQGLATPIPAGAQIHIIGSIAGG